MKSSVQNQDRVLNAIRDAAKVLGHPPSKVDFIRLSGISEYQYLKYFPSWREAVRAAGLDPNSTNINLDPSILLEDWGKLVRRIRRIPTRVQYKREGNYSPGTFEKKFGAWSVIPSHFRSFAESRPEWADIIEILPLEVGRTTSEISPFEPGISISAPTVVTQRYSKLNNRPTYGNPIDFRGLRHEPVNEDGVVFLFGMVARELGYLVEAIQAGYPDCEAKRQISAGKWQRVRIEFEYESRNFRDHGHSPDGCDLIVCWRHNWAECPVNLEVVELCNIIRTLASED